MSDLAEAFRHLAENALARGEGASLKTQNDAIKIAIASSKWASEIEAGGKPFGGKYSWIDYLESLRQVFEDTFPDAP